MAAFEIAAGWTEALIFQLLSGGSGWPIPGGANVSLLLFKADDGTPVSVAGSIAVEEAATGKIRYTPDAADLALGNYRARWKVSLAGAVGFFPSGRAQTWVVHEQ